MKIALTISLLFIILVNYSFDCSVNHEQHDSEDGISSVSMTTDQSNKKEGYVRLFFELATNRNFLLHPNSSYLIDRVHLVRVPKAASTSFSIVARRIVGCNPPGPCCKYPGDPVGSCPSHDLFHCQTMKKVIGCTGHNPEYLALKSDSMPSITIVREPKARALSAYFYPNHHNMNCHGNISQCFFEYVRDIRYQNILVKMFTGEHSYGPQSTCFNSSDCPHSLQLASSNIRYFEFIGIVELWELSLLLFHYKFSQIPPVFDEFALYANSTLPTSPTSDTSTSASSGRSHGESQRLNTNDEYLQFKKTAMRQFEQELTDQSRLDIELYHFLLEKFCRLVQRSGYWKNLFVQEYWEEYAPPGYNTSCSLKSMVSASTPVATRL
jgi:hypothetical protein